MKLANKLFIIIVLTVVTLGISPNFVYSSTSIDAGDVKITAEVPTVALIISNLAIEHIDSTSAIISFDTNISSKAVIYFGTTSGYGFTMVDNAFSTHHVFYLTGLTPDTLYYFKIIAENSLGQKADSGEQKFKTLPEEIIPSPSPIVTFTPSPTIPAPFHEAPPYPETFGAPEWIDIFTRYFAAKIMYVLLAFLALAILIFSLILPYLSALPLVSLSDWFLALFIYLGKKKWGIVYDAKTKKPVPRAKVALYEFKTNKLLETCISNNLGEYGFEIKEGKYYLTVEKTDYEYTSKIFKKDYHKETIEIKKKSVPVINIPIDADEAVVEYRLLLLSKINNFFNAIRYPVLVAGTLISIIFYYKWPVVFNLLVMLLYFVTWIWELIKLKNRNNVKFSISNSQ